MARISAVRVRPLVLPLKQPYHCIARRASGPCVANTCQAVMK